jgi:hypothetical protein
MYTPKDLINLKIAVVFSEDEEERIAQQKDIQSMLCEMSYKIKKYDFSSVKVGFTNEKIKRLVVEFYRGTVEFMPYTGWFTNEGYIEVPYEEIIGTKIHKVEFNKNEYEDLMK